MSKKSYHWTLQGFLFYMIFIYLLKVFEQCLLKTLCGERGKGGRERGLRSKGGAYMCIAHKERGSEGAEWKWNESASVHPDYSIPLLTFSFTTQVVMTPHFVAFHDLNFAAWRFTNHILLNIYLNPWCVGTDGMFEPAVRNSFLRHKSVSEPMKGIGDLLPIF